MSKGFASSYRIVLLSVGIFAAFGGLGARLVWIQVTGREALLRSVVKARQQVIVEQAKRGDILDARGTLLATSRSLIKLSVDPWFLRPGDGVKWRRLAALIGMPLSELKTAFGAKFRPAPEARPAAVSAVSPSTGLVLDFKALRGANATPAASSALVN